MLEENKIIEPEEEQNVEANHHEKLPEKVTIEEGSVYLDKEQPHSKGVIGIVVTERVIADRDVDIIKCKRFFTIGDNVYIQGDTTFYYFSLERDFEYSPELSGKIKY